MTYDTVFCWWALRWKSQTIISANSGNLTLTYRPHKSETSVPAKLPIRVISNYISDTRDQTLGSTWHEKSSVLSSELPKYCTYTLQRPCPVRLGLFNAIAMSLFNLIVVGVTAQHEHPNSIIYCMLTFLI